MPKHKGIGRINFRAYASRTAKKVKKMKRRLDNVVAARAQSSVGEDETSDGNPGNINGAEIDVAPPAYQRLKTKQTAAEPAPRGSVLQELDLTLDNPTERALFQLGTLPSELRQAILHHDPCRPKGPFATSSTNDNRRIFSEQTLSCTFCAMAMEIE